MSASPRASVTSQVVPQPFILASRSSSAQRSSPSPHQGMSRTDSNSSLSSSPVPAAPAAAPATAAKRDSAVGIGHLVQRVSELKRNRLSRQGSGESVEAMAPVYRLYPHQSANGRRELRAMERPESESRPQTSFSTRSHSKGLNSLDSTRIAMVLTADDAQTRDGHASDDFQKRHATTRHNYTQSESQIPHSPRGANTPIADGVSDLDENGANGAATPGLASGSGTKRPLNIPNRTSSTTSNRGANPMQTLISPVLPDHALDSNRVSQNSLSESAQDDDAYYGPGARSSAGSVFSNDTTATSIHTLPPLQAKGPADYIDFGALEPVIEDDPSSWDLVGPPPAEEEVGLYALERRAEQLFSSEHLRTIFADPKLLLRFTTFLNTHRPQSIPILIYYLDAMKALRAISYANAIAEALEPISGQTFTLNGPPKATINSVLESKAMAAFDVLVQEDLPAYIAWTWIQVVSVSIQRRITGTLAPHLREASEGLAEVFCLTDPSRQDSPIVFASEEFTRTTQYGMNYLIGRNCRFLQGPRTNPTGVQRLAIATAEGKEHTEIMVNYRRDGSPFLNLLMIAPLMDSRGVIRYYIGAQVDVSGLLKDCAEMDGLLKMVQHEQDFEAATSGPAGGAHKDEFQELSEMFNGAELDTVRRFGGRMHKEYVDDADPDAVQSGRPRLVLKDSGQDLDAAAADNDADEDGRKSERGRSPVPSTLREKINGRLEGIYSHYLLIRPAPSLRILFTSPSLRVPGILQSPFLNRVGGSARVRSDLRAALTEGRGVTAKIRWLSRADEDGEGEGRPRWIHCTPLLGHSGAVGVWMVVLVDDVGADAAHHHAQQQQERGVVNVGGKKFRPAPPISNVIGGKEWDASHARDSHRFVNHYDQKGRPVPAAAARFSDSASGQGSSTPVIGSPQPGGAARRSQSQSRSRSRNPNARTLEKTGSQVFSSAASEFSFNLKG